jgi:hypothetical protein
MSLLVGCDMVQFAVRPLTDFPPLAINPMKTIDVSKIDFVKLSPDDRGAVETVCAKSRPGSPIIRWRSVGSNVGAAGAHERT